MTELHWLVSFLFMWIMGQTGLFIQMIERFFVQYGFLVPIVAEIHIHLQIAFLRLIHNSQNRIFVTCINYQDTFVLLHYNASWTKYASFSLGQNYHITILVHYDDFSCCSPITSTMKIVIPTPISLWSPQLPYNMHTPTEKLVVATVVRAPL